MDVRWQHLQNVMATPEYLQYEAFNMNVAFKGVLDPSVKLFYLVNSSHQGPST